MMLKNSQILKQITDEDVLKFRYERWVNLAYRFDPDCITRGQKAALTRAWNRFAEQAQRMGLDPVKLSKYWAES